MEVSVYELKCSLCGKKLRHPNRAELMAQISSHVDTECKTASTMRDWDAKGIYPEMMKILRYEAVLEQVRKLVKKYGFEQVKEALMELEE